MAMATAKRPRACDACHSIKIKCELGSTGGPGPCERCVRLDRSCTITPPKSQKDRVAELEAQVAALTKLLRRQSLDDQCTTRAPSVGPVSIHESDQAPEGDMQSKKRKLREDVASSSHHATLAQLDQIVPFDKQESLVEKYVHLVLPLTPLILLPLDWTVAHLRETTPVLFSTIVYSMSTGCLSEPEQDKLGAHLLATFDSMDGEKNQRSIELVQSMQLAALWYRAPKNHRQVAAFQLVERAVNVAKDIGLCGSANSSSLGVSADQNETDPLASLRAWLTCHILTTAITILMRKASFKSLGSLDTFSTYMLEYSECSRRTDRILCHFVKAELLCERIATDLELLNFSVCKDVSDLDMQISMRALQNSIFDWVAQRPLDPACPSLQFYEQVSTMYLHETVLHTPTNKQSFAAPFLAERLSMTDFPLPVIVTEQHISSLHALKSASQTLLDLALGFDLVTWMSLPFLLFVARVAYAEYILMKLYIATSAPGNTFGAFLDPDSLHVERYLDRFIDIATSAQKVDSSCPAARILMAPTRLKEWMIRYNFLNGLSPTDSNYGSKEATPTLVDEMSSTFSDAALSYDATDWNVTELLGDASYPNFPPTY